MAVFWKFLNIDDPKQVVVSAARGAHDDQSWINYDAGISTEIGAAAAAAAKRDQKGTRQKLQIRG